MKMKVFNYSELHFAEVTFYKIHTLVFIEGTVSISPLAFPISTSVDAVYLLHISEVLHFQAFFLAKRIVEST